MTLFEIGLLAVFGALGALSRYGVGSLASRMLGAGFPYGTLIVNVVGCLLLGFIMELSLSAEGLSKGVRTAMTVGFLGAFTTFSTFGYETVQFLRQGAWLPALGNVAANVLVGLLAVGLGLMAARLVVGDPSAIDPRSGAISIPAPVPVAIDTDPARSKKR